MFECEITKSQFGWVNTAIPAGMADFDEAFEDAQAALEVSRKLRASLSRLIILAQRRLTLLKEQGAPDL